MMCKNSKMNLTFGDYNKHW